MHGEEIGFGYGLWSLVLVNVGIFVILALSYLAPVKRREWRSFGVLAAFGDAYRAYEVRVPMFVPRLRRLPEPRWSER